ncbi:MAG TPA: hypothetical protein VHO25_17610 [Polyangiaceae bacterium]|nr:hypothetical protein [Polyangiaceae bacterium]
MAVNSSGGFALAALAVLGCAVTGCGVEPIATGQQPVPRGAQGVLVINTDYKSTSVSALDFAGDLLTQNLISTSSASTGLSVALSGDVGLPSGSTPDRETVLIDRYPAAVLSWVNLDTAQVRAQLSVATGFSSNPHDYVAVSRRKAYVPRYNPNLGSGEQPFDTGHDVLIVDPASARITGSVDLMPAITDEATGLYARADRAVIIDGLLRVLVSVFNTAYSRPGDSRLVSIDPDTDRIVAVHRIAGLTSCSNFAFAPDGTELAVACNGFFRQAAATGFPDSAIVRLTFDGVEVTELARYPTTELGGNQVGVLSYADQDHLVFTTLGRRASPLSVAAPDTLRVFDVTTNQVSAPILQTQRVPLSLGDVLCVPSENSCFVADAETLGGVVHRFELDDGMPISERLISVDTATGLPPRYLGRF